MTGERVEERGWDALRMKENMYECELNAQVERVAKNAQ